jgi:hypothetical protein
MITFAPSGPRAAVNGLAVYLDNRAFDDFAEGDPDALRTGDTDLMFSFANTVVDLTGAQGGSRDAARVFLDDLDHTDSWWRST